MAGQSKPIPPPPNHLEIVMLNPTCLFCKIIQQTIPSTIIKENDHVLVIQDISPKAPTHYLLLTKKHIDNVTALTGEDAAYSSALFAMAQTLGNELPSKAFNLIINNGAAAGQSVFHLHMHFLAGKNLYEHGLRL